MEKGNNLEKRIVQWKKCTSNWSAEQFMDMHPEYKQTDEKVNMNYWPVIFLLADQLGFDEVSFHDFFDEKPKCQLADVVFAMYVCRLYGSSHVEDFFSSKSVLNTCDIHDFLKTQEIIVNAMETEDAESKKNHKADGDFSELWNHFMRSVQMYEETRKQYEETIERLVKIAEQSPKKTENELRKEDWDRILNLEKENAVLKVRLDAEKREAKLKIQSIEEMRKFELQQLRDQIMILVKKKRKTYRFSKRQLKPSEKMEMTDREMLILKILGSNEYPGFLKEYLYESFQNGMDLKVMQTFDKPKIDRKNFEMMKKVLVKTMPLKIG